tara:strand:+ start:421 stop:873 length:453 start_codon:yes stop_codon:yes gene_type:complete
MTARVYTTRRSSIVTALSSKLKSIDGTGEFLTDLYENVEPRLLFWDEVTDFPAVHINAGQETREYQGGGYRDRFLTLTIRCYVSEENAQDALSALLEDVETVLETNSALKYTDKLGVEHSTHQISLLSIDTDEGVLEPLGVGEMQVEVRY